MGLYDLYDLDALYDDPNDPNDYDDHEDRGADALPVLLPQSAGVVDARDRALCLLRIYDLLAGPLRADGAARLARHPSVAQLQWRLEQSWLRELAAHALPAGLSGAAAAGSDPTGAVVGALRALAARDRLPAVYRWMARQASYQQIVAFLTLEGGPDAGFDDLVAACQIGLSGRPKLELAHNYWDEMGCGDGAAVHTRLHDDLSQALGMVAIPGDAQPVEGLERVALGGLLAANHWLQPEMLGALGLIELQAGPRCRLVLQGLDRVGGPRAAYPFYEIHADVDPVHGRDWVDNAIIPVLAERPEWAPRIIRGAWWRSLLNARFFAMAEQAALSAVAA